jgi:hypothetical protein
MIIGGFDLIFLNNCFGCIGVNSDHKAFAFGLQGIEQGVFLAASISDRSLSN